MVDHLRRNQGEGSPSPARRNPTPTTHAHASYINISPKPSPRLSHAQPHPHNTTTTNAQYHQTSPGLGFPFGMPGHHNAFGSASNSGSPSLVSSPTFGASRLPSFSSKGMALFGNIPQSAESSGTPNGPGGGIGSGTTSPGLLSNNVSFTSADQYLISSMMDGLGGPVPHGMPHPGMPRSRRSSVGLAVSVSLASRSRSRTPKLSSPPMSPSRRLSKEISTSSFNQVLGQVNEGDSTSGRASKKPKWLKGDGGDIEFANFGWDEAFEDDDEDYVNLTHVPTVNHVMVDHKTPRMGGTTGLEVEVQQMALNVAHNHSALVQSPVDGREHDVDDIFPPGFLFGEGHTINGEEIEEVDPVARSIANGRNLPASSGSSVGSASSSIRGSTPKQKTFEVIRKLGSGSYAVVYLVKEVGGSQEYALKCLSKQDLEEDALQVQLFEATIHLTLPRHRNIVTLHQTLQTKHWLFLLLEMCPGEDLFYWLEHSRDSPPPSSVESHESIQPPPESEPVHPNARPIPMSSSNLPSSAVPFSTSAMIQGMGTPFGLSHSPVARFTHNHHRIESPSHSSSNGHATTPTTPSLLSAYSANALLSNRRLKLIASMFGQMCEAVQICHDVGVSHRDIKPENFICCDSQELSATMDNDDHANFGRKKVIVKLTDFGLATTDEESGDVECGSRPYMAYECRNELGPSYAPRPADVWSLGVVLLNMLFHRNPWTDPVPGNKNFDGFMEDPVEFLLTRFTGIGLEVASYLAERVFATKCEERVSAKELGRWSRNLPSMIGGRKAVSALRMSYLSGSKDKEYLDFKKSPIEHKGVSSSLMTQPSIASKMSNGHGHHSGNGGGHGHAHQAKADVEIDDQEQQESQNVLEDYMSSLAPTESNIGSINDSILSSEPESRTASRKKKRGTRSKNKAAAMAAAALMAGMPAPRQVDMFAQANSEKESILLSLAEASQDLARDLSKAKKPAEKPVIDMDEFPSLGDEVKPSEVKRSKWKALISMSNENPELQALAKKVREREGQPNQSAPARLQHIGQSKSTTAVRTMDSTFSTASPGLTMGSSSETSSFNPTSSLPGGTEGETWRRSPATTDGVTAKIPQVHDPVAVVQQEDDRGRNLYASGRPRRTDGSVSRGNRFDPRDMSPVPTLANSERDTASLYSMSSLNTFSTMSSASSKNSQGSNRYFPKPPNPTGAPRSMVKQMDGVPWELMELPRQHRMDKHGNMPEGDIFTRPPMPKKQSTKRLNRPPLESISEKPPSFGKDAALGTSPKAQSSPMAVSPSPTTSGFSTITQTESRKSTASVNNSSTGGVGNAGAPPVKLKMQIASLGKMLSGLKSGKSKD